MHRDEKKPPSIKEIAAMAGVSIATVSRVINESGLVAPETEQKIKKIINDCGYLPNMAAKGLRSNRTEIIGIVVPDITNEYFSHLVRNIQSELFKKNFSVIICNSDEDVNQEKHALEILKAQKVSGIIATTSDEICKIVPADMPTIYVDCVPAEIDKRQCVAIESDNEAGGKIATRELINNGCRRILCIGGRKDVQIHRERRSGYYLALEEAGIPVDKTLVYLMEERETELSGFEQGKRLIEDLLKNHVEFDGIFGMSDVITLGALAALYHMNVPVPEKVKLVGFDDMPSAQFSYKPLTTIHQSTRLIANAAVENLLKMVNSKDITEKVIKIPVSLVKRETT